MYIGIDLGGTNIAAGITDRRGMLLQKKSAPTGKERPTDEIVKDMARLGNDAGIIGAALLAV